jgi:putative ABC transport system permease protein
VQFTIALFVFSGAGIISQQVNYFFNKDLGYQKESLITLGVPRDWTPTGLAKMERIRDELSGLKEVNKVSLSYEIPNNNYGGYNGVYKAGQDSVQAIHTQFLATDENYAETYGIGMLAGQFFQNPKATFQPDRIVINEAALKALNYNSAEEAIGQQVRIHSFPNALSITGVSQNFHFESMHKTIKPLAFVHIRGGNAYRYLTLKIAPSNLSKSMAALENKWRQLMPDAPFEYTFMDETLQKLYQSEIQLKKASQVATVLSIVIVLLGILGMVSLNVARRTREVGIRKVLGASGMSVVALFLKEFLLVMIFAVAVAFPLAFFAMKKWLETYAYRIDIGWATFAEIGFAFLILITALVCLQTYKAALMNPVRSLKSD